ncbi:MAG: hypothetical protein EXR75_14220 [Myxococcales bacterium]|nr:hypothetical protein [Myxococcales bacterium]
MRTWAIRLAVAVFLAAGSMQTLARATLHGDFEAARSHFTSGQYEEAAQLFARIVAEPLDPNAPDFRKRREILEAARPVYAACLVGLGRTSEADAIILEQLRDDPFYEPAAGQFAQPVMLRFIRVREGHQAELDDVKQRVLLARQDSVQKDQRQRELDSARLQRLEELAGTDTLVRERSRLVSFAPLGVGQFQNGNTGLGIFFASSELVAAAASIVSAIVAHDFATVDCRQRTDVDCPELERRFQVARAVNWSSFALTGALAITGIVEAQVAFEPTTTTTRTRPLPPRVTVSPAVVVGQDGAVVGVALRF